MRIICNLTNVTIDTYNSDDLTSFFVIESTGSNLDKYVAPLPFIFKTFLKDGLEPQTEEDKEELLRLARFLFMKYNISVKDIDSSETAHFNYNYEGSEISEKHCEMLAGYLLDSVNNTLEITLKNEQFTFSISAFTAFSEAVDFYRDDFKHNSYQNIRDGGVLELLRKAAKEKDPNTPRDKLIDVIVSKLPDAKNSFDNHYLTDLFGYTALFPTNEEYFYELHDGIEPKTVLKAFNVIWLFKHMTYLNISFSQQYVQPSFYLMSDLDQLIDSFQHKVELLKNLNKK